MKMYRKRRMIMDQAARRMVSPKDERIVNKRASNLVVGYGNARFRSAGPRVQMLRAVIRALRALRTARGVQVALVFVDEFRTTKLCHRCFRPTQQPYRMNEETGRSLPAVRPAGPWPVPDRRFRDCANCGENATMSKRWGRDSNAALNILRVLNSALDNVALPFQFLRSTGLWPAGAFRPRTPWDNVTSNTVP